MFTVPESKCSSWRGNGGRQAALGGFKPELLKFLSRTEEGAEDRSDDRHFKSRRSKCPGHTSLYNPIHKEWHDFPTKDCFPSIVAEAGKRNKGGAA